MSTDISNGERKGSVADLIKRFSKTEGEERKEGVVVKPVGKISFKGEEAKTINIGRNEGEEKKEDVFKSVLNNTPIKQEDKNTSASVKEIPLTIDDDNVSQEKNQETEESATNPETEESLIDEEDNASIAVEDEKEDKVENEDAGKNQEAEGEIMEEVKAESPANKEGNDEKELDEEEGKQETKDGNDAVDKDTSASKEDDMKVLEVEEKQEIEDAADKDTHVIKVEDDHTLEEEKQETEEVGEPNEEPENAPLKKKVDEKIEEELEKEEEPQQSSVSVPVDKQDDDGLNPVKPSSATSLGSGSNSGSKQTIKGDGSKGTSKTPRKKKKKKKKTAERDEFKERKQAKQQRALDLQNYFDENGMLSIEDQQDDDDVSFITVPKTIRNTDDESRHIGYESPSIRKPKLSKLLQDDEEEEDSEEDGDLLYPKVAEESTTSYSEDDILAIVSRRNVQGKWEIGLPQDPTTKLQQPQPQEIIHVEDDGTVSVSLQHDLGNIRQLPLQMDALDTGYDEEMGGSMNDDEKELLPPELRQEEKHSISLSLSASILCIVLVTIVIVIVVFVSQK